MYIYIYIATHILISLPRILGTRYQVCIAHTAHTAHIVHIVHTAHTGHTGHTGHIVHSVHTVHTYVHSNRECTYSIY